MKIVKINKKNKIKYVFINKKNTCTVSILK